MRPLREATPESWNLLPPPSLPHGTWCPSDIEYRFYKALPDRRLLEGCRKRVNYLQSPLEAVVPPGINHVLSAVSPARGHL